MAGVELKEVIKKYGDVQVIHGIDLSIEHGDCVWSLGLRKQLVARCISATAM
jgi:ABC-type sugar transport system ATPase subunit